jgi:hypothetical protein
MQIEVGKYYRTRDGRKVGPAEHNDTNDASDYPWNVPWSGSFYAYDTNGKSCLGNGHREDDLIAEWTDDKPGPTLSSETIDQIAIDSLRFHFQGELEPLQREAFRIVLRYYGASV